MMDKKYNKLVLKRKRRSIKKKFLLSLKILLLLIFFAGLLWGFNYFYNSDYFKIKNIAVEGNSYYSNKEITGVANVALGLNIFEIDKKAIEDSLEEELVWLKSVVLKKVFPDSIEINVTERKPFVKAAYASEQYLLDDESIVLDILDIDNNGKYPDLLIVKNAVDYRPGIGEKIARKSILSCGDIYKALEPDIKKEIKEAYISDNFSGDIIFITINDKKIIFGNSDKIVDKNNILREIISQINDKKISFTSIDISNVDDPVIE